MESPIPTTKQQNQLDLFISLLKEFNLKINLFSRHLSATDLQALIHDSMGLFQHITSNKIIDAGSGNGIVGIPLAILSSIRPVVLVETRTRKAQFLCEAVQRLHLNHVEVAHMDIRQYLRKHLEEKDCTMVARGFPTLAELVKPLKKGSINELVVITSSKKTKKIPQNIENCRQKIYNIPAKDNLVIFKLENVSRET